MVARTWYARTTQQSVSLYRKHYVEKNLPKLRAVKGFIGAQLYTRMEDESVEIFVVTFWKSFDAIDAFASPDREAAVVPPDMAPLLVSYDPRVRHFEIAVDTFAAANS
jgi:heme-degrading monooxygenase HmoA